MPSYSSSSGFSSFKHISVQLQACRWSLPSSGLWRNFSIRSWSTVSNKVSSPPVSWSTLLWPLGCLNDWTAAELGDEQTELASTDVISVSCQACCQCAGNWAETSREVVACSTGQQVEVRCDFCGEGCVHTSGLWLAGWHSWVTMLVWEKHLSVAVGLSLGELPADRMGGSSCSSGFCANSLQNWLSRKSCSLLPTSDSTSG